MRIVIKILILAVIYYLTAKIGLSFAPVSGFASLFWPPSGIALAALLLFGNYLVYGILIGAFVANFLNGASVPVALGIALGNTLEAFVGVLMLRKVRFNPALESLKDALSFILLAAFISTLIGATMGPLSLLLGRVIHSSEFLPTWTAWWVGDILGVLIFAPVILVWVTIVRNKASQIGVAKIVEILLSNTAFFLFTSYLYDAFNFFPPNLRPIRHLIFPVLIWLALSFGQTGSVIGVLIVSLITTWVTLLGQGPFNQYTLTENLFYLQTYIASISITFLTLSAMLTERNRLSVLKDEFISAASHELRTPLTTIKAYTQLLSQRLKGKGDKNLNNYVLRMDEQVNRLTKLVFDMLDATRSETGKLEFNFELFSLTDLIKEICLDLNQSEKSSRIVFKNNRERIIWGDKYRVGQVLTNLLTNAMKYSPKSKKIVVKLVVHQDYATCSIRDYGEGIAQDDQEYIFKRFYQTNNSHRNGGTGLGLGLYISSEIVRRHGGKIWVKSQLKKGSTFFFSLPIGRSVQA